MRSLALAFLLVPFLALASGTNHPLKSVVTESMYVLVAKPVQITLEKYDWSGYSKGTASFVPHPAHSTREHLVCLTENCGSENIKNFIISWEAKSTYKAVDDTHPKLMFVSHTPRTSRKNLVHPFAMYTVEQRDNDFYIDFERTYYTCFPESVTVVEDGKKYVSVAKLKKYIQTVKNLPSAIPLEDCPR